MQLKVKIVTIYIHRNDKELSSELTSNDTGKRLDI